VVSLDTPIGKVVHFFDRISVVVISLSSKISIGDEVRFVDNRHGIDFSQKIESLELDHKVFTEGQPQTEVATKVAQPVKEGALVYKV